MKTQGFKKKIKILYLIAFVYFSYATIGFSQYTEIHCKHFIYGYPKGCPATNDLIIRDIYALSSNDSTKFADWVAYRLDLKTITGPSQKERDWQADPWLDEWETLEPEDYKDASKAIGIDRGHQAPLADFKGSEYAYETNYLSNITPQNSNLNRGIWKNLEDYERKLTEKYGLIYVMTGPLYEKEMPKLPKADEYHKVPSGYWKIIIIPYEQDIRNKSNLEIFGFIFNQNIPKNSALKDYLVSIDEIQRRSHLDFFWALDDKLEKSLESKVNPHFDIYFTP
jgi:endonuclease G